MPAETVISHAFVLPDHNFYEWLAVLRPYLAKFERVAVVRSPAGNNLNRFRNVTAVNAPLTWWNDSALVHIRRVYPSVVMVDVIQRAVRPPSWRRLSISVWRLTTATARRITTHSIFSVDSRSTGRPARGRWRCLERFNADGERGDQRRSISVLSHENADVVCAAPGVVSCRGPTLRISVEIRWWMTNASSRPTRASRTRWSRSAINWSWVRYSANAAAIAFDYGAESARRVARSLLGYDNVMNPRDYIYIRSCALGR